MRGTERSALRALSLAMLALFLPACAQQLDLQTVQKYAQATTDASASFTTVSNDYGSACDSIAELQLAPRLWPYPLASPTPLPASVSAALAGPSPAPQAAPTMAPDVWKAPTPQACRIGHDIGVEWAKRNDIVVGYVHSLGAIASVDVKPSFSPLTDALAQGGVITQAQDTAFTNLAGVIGGIVVGADVQDELTKTVKSANGPLKDSIAALKVVNNSYGVLLTSEFQQTRSYYQRLISSECYGETKPPASYGAMAAACGKLQSVTPALADRVFLQRQRLNESLAAINQKLSASASYAHVLDDIQNTHQELYDKATSSPSLNDYITILQKDVLPLYQDVEALRKAT